MGEPEGVDRISASIPGGRTIVLQECLGCGNLNKAVGKARIQTARSFLRTDAGLLDDATPDFDFRSEKCADPLGSGGPALVTERRQASIEQIEANGRDHEQVHGGDVRCVVPH